MSSMTMPTLDRGVTTAKTHFPMKSRQRPVIFAGATASLFETVPSVIDLEKYARQLLASRTLRKLHLLA